jgi:hypothetical protein
MILTKQPWLKSASFDLPLILLPSVISVLLVAVFSDHLDGTSSVPVWAWVVFVLGIDVSHVYSTLFRTYFNSHEFQENKVILTLIPLGVWLLGVLVYSVSGLLFWRLLAYIAVFHFIRQQYGFLRIYSRTDEESKLKRWLEQAVVYSATLYPILFWHSSEQRNFHWFVDGDFLVGLPSIVATSFGILYLLTLLTYVGFEISRLRRGLAFNIPKNLVVLGTALSWYVGIVHFNGDMIFTITNVVSHGIPYMALVWLYGERQKEKSDSPQIVGRFSYKLFFSWYSLPLYFGLLLFFGFMEEGLWDGFVWREHSNIFWGFSTLPKVTSKDTLAWLVPLLTLPQATHYVLDGFIWKLKDSRANWQKVLFGERASK